MSGKDKNSLIKSGQIKSVYIALTQMINNNIPIADPYSITNIIELENISQ